MLERGMIFNAEMVRAILDGRKTQTRRPVRFPVLDKNLGCELAGNELAGELSAGNYLNSAFGKPDDRIWVRETWGVVSHELDEDGRIRPWTPDRPATAINEMPFGNGYYSGHAIYAADGDFTWGDDDGYEDGRSCWKPSIHMPRWASRITLEITNVGVQRLQSISPNDAAREGLVKLPATGRYCINQGVQYFGGASQDAREVFSWLWESIYGADSWKANPWVWVIEFKRVEGGAA
ncbi:TPA: hypothetical protein MD887_004801 [Klebsiella oxytoca]|nr:hypothetical protein [Klebsiella oxytoca]HDX8749962.1 hypothetical protein [Klebsiella michiganensis]HDX9092651.1 hypothetical protein [Klebsiella michiganensis]